MPARPQWLLRTPLILDEIAALDQSVIDRAVIEQTFGVRRRRAVQLMSAFGGYQAGNTILIERRRLLERLEKIVSSGEFCFEQRRRERLTESLDQARQRRRAAAISIPITRTVVKETLDRLPTGITLAPGLLRIEFQKALELLEKLYQLAQAISNDFEQFEILVTPENIPAAECPAYNEEFINSQRLDPSTTAKIDYNAGVATAPLLQESPVTPDSARIGVASVGAAATDISLLQDGLPETAFVWTGAQVELVFTFNSPQVLNRVSISLPAHQGLDVLEFSSSPDGVLKEDLLAELPAANQSIDGSAGKYSGDWIADFDPRSVQQLRIVLADFVGSPSITIRDVSFFQRTFSNSGMAQSLRIDAPQGTVVFHADQHTAGTLTAISH